MRLICSEQKGHSLVRALSSVILLIVGGLVAKSVDGGLFAGRRSLSCLRGSAGNGREGETKAASERSERVRTLWRLVWERGWA